MKTMIGNLLRESPFLSGLFDYCCLGVALLLLIGSCVAVYILLKRMWGDVLRDMFHYTGKTQPPAAPLPPGHHDYKQRADAARDEHNRREADKSPGA